MNKIRRVKETVPLDVAKQRIHEYSMRNGNGPFPASAIANVIWPDATFLNTQGAGAAASRVLKRLGFKWGSNEYKTNWGWRIF